jgi:RecA-family ATPase
LESINEIPGDEVGALGQSLGNFMSTTFITAEQIITGLARGEMGMIVALPGVGKTSLALNVTISGACGKEFVPLIRSIEPRRVAFFDFENRAGVQNDLATMLSVLNEADRKLVDQNLTIIVDKQISGEELRLSEPKHLALVTQLCEQRAFDLIIIDALAAGFNLINENDNAEVNRIVIIPLQKLLKYSGAAGLLVHHIGKAGEGSNGKIYRARGASVLPAYARAVFDLSPNRVEENCVILHCAKIKGPGFKDTVLRLDRDARWFHPVQVRELSSQSSYQRLLPLIKGEMSPAEISAVAKKN